MRRQIPSKPIEIAEVEKTVDRFLNLALSTQGQIENLSKEKNDLESEILKLKEERDLEQSKNVKKIALIRDEVASLEQEKKVLADVVLKSRQDFLTSRDLATKEFTAFSDGIKEQKEMMLAEVETLGQAIENAKKELEVLTKKGVDNKKVVLEKETFIQQKETEIFALEDKFKALSEEVIDNEEQLKEQDKRINDLNVVKEKIQSGNVILEDLLGQEREKRLELRKLLEDRNKAELEYNEFQEKMLKTKAVLQKIRQSIETEARRLKIRTEEQSIEKFLNEL